MKLISLKYLGRIEKDHLLKVKVIYKILEMDLKLNIVFENPEESVFDIVRKATGLGFSESVEWIADIILQEEVPEATEREKVQMQKYARVVLEDFKSGQL
jgi:hypothetical protein